MSRIASLAAVTALGDVRHGGKRVAPAAATEVAALADWTAGIACVTRGAVAEAPELFDRAARGLRAAGRPGPAAETQVPKIMALSMLGRTDEAVACALAAQRELLALGLGAAAARVSQNLGSLLLFRDRYAEAAAHFREAAVLFASQGEGAAAFDTTGLSSALRSAQQGKRLAPPPASWVKLATDRPPPTRRTRRAGRGPTPRGPCRTGPATSSARASWRLPSAPTSTPRGSRSTA